MEKTRLYSLTSLRFLAAVLIVLHHSRGNFGFSQALWPSLVFDNAVSFFFILSGFILFYTYPSLSGKDEAIRFWQARIARLWPLHVAAFILIFFLFPSSVRSTKGGNTLPIALLNLGMVQAWIPIWKYYYSYNHLSWAVSTEFAFYLCFPFLVRQWRRTWWIKLAASFVLVVFLVGLCQVLRLPGVSANYPGVTNEALLYINPLGRLFEFVLGMTLALGRQKLQPRLKIGPGSGTMLEMGVVALAALVMGHARYWAAFAGHRFWWVGSAGSAWLVHGGISCLFLGLLILVMSLEKGAISRLLSFRLPVVLGEMSYAIYLLHQILIRYYARRAASLAFLPDGLAYAGFWVILLLLAYLVWSRIEIPCRRLLLGMRRPPKIMASSGPPSP